MPYQLHWPPVVFGLLEAIDELVLLLLLEIVLLLIVALLLDRILEITLLLDRLLAAPSSGTVPEKPLAFSVVNARIKVPFWITTLAGSKST